MNQETIKTLVEKWIAGTITLPEREELDQLIDQKDSSVASSMEKMLESTARPAVYDASRWDPVMHRILQTDKLTGMPQERKAGRLVSISFRRIAVAASIIFILGISSYLLFFNRQPIFGDPDSGGTAHMPDIPAPDQLHATITLADGRQVYLDSAGIGNLAKEGNVNVIKNANGEIVYESSFIPDVSQIKYNTLSNPRGSKLVSLILSDGSKIWLNSESSVKYPTAFAGNSREVEITGEAYFEVMPDKSKPFLVSVGEMQVEVMGTHFNINAYSDEPVVKTTLLEGKVRVSSHGRMAILKPGEQAQLNPSTSQLFNSSTPQSLTITLPDLSEVMAWKNGQFRFNNTDIVTMMRQAARWYNINVVYPGGIPNERFGGTLSRNVSLAKFLMVLEYSGVVAKIEGRTVTIMNKTK